MEDGTSGEDAAAVGRSRVVADFALVEQQGGVLLAQDAAATDEARVAGDPALMERHGAVVADTAASVCRVAVNRALDQGCKRVLAVENAVAAGAVCPRR